MKEIVRLFPEVYASLLKKYVRWDVIQEVRLRVGKPIEIIDSNGVKSITNTDISLKDLSFVLNQVSQFSVYKFKEELREGYITIEGGHRIGLAGKANMQRNELDTLRNITFMNIRVAHAHIDSSKHILPYLFQEERWMNTLIIGPPHSGKTTVLRNISKWIGSNNSLRKASKVGIVDERSELAACLDGIPQMDVGARTDVMDSCPKAVGMMMMIRSMSPEVLIVDEIGGGEDAAAVKEAVHTGVQVICSVHGQNLSSVSKRRDVGHLIEEQVFDRFVLLPRLQANSRYFISILDQDGRIMERVKGDGSDGMARSPDRFSRHHLGRL
ncbi:stage III sporulation protein AA [Halobacillus sp. A5]|uniref:stage III sporulation protein AA n=1 Tax=Halobacillus sp. A5 TaxID=2880263 RepID=UPI0020A6A3E5|nr:stage III sporulation protein AA [Halobacillus sp. A5]MCP3025717.1 stage III sporulation protein AA [Halobacillus sp. A5]